MKKLILFGVLLSCYFFVQAQDVAREMVILEITTSTKCTYCPGAAMGAEDLLANGKFVAVIEHHNTAQGSDPFVTSASQARCVSLGYGGSNPTAFFDAKLKVVGGSHTQSMYSNYLPKYNTRISKPSPLYLTMDVTNEGLDYTAEVTVVKTNTISSTNLRMMFVVTQSHIAYNWQGQNQLNYVNRIMLPDANGTEVDFSSGNTQTFTMNFTLDAAWPLEDCEIIAFVEDMTGKEVLNGKKRAVIDLQPEFTASETSVVTNQPVTFTNTTIGGYIDAPETYQWFFSGAIPDASTEKDPTVTYTDAGNYDVTLIVNRGGQIDTLTKSQYIQVNYPVGAQDNIISSSRVFPNPSNGVFRLDLFSTTTISMNLSVVNLINIPVFQESGIIFNGAYTRDLDLSQLAKGVYFIILETQGSKTVKKIVIN